MHAYCPFFFGLGRILFDAVSGMSRGNGGMVGSVYASQIEEKYTFDHGKMTLNSGFDAGRIHRPMSD